MKTLTILLTAVLVSVALAGCSAGSLPGSTAASGTGPSASSSPASTKPAASGGGSGAHVDVCAVVSLAKVNSVTGRTYVSTSTVKTATQSGCNYVGSDPTALGFSIGIYYDGGSAEYTKLESGLSLGDPVKPIPGLGDQAVDVTEAVIAQYGTDVVFAADDIHPGDMAELPQSAYVQLIKTLQAAR